MAKKEICSDCPYSMPKRDRSIITKVGHIKREIKTNNRLSDKSIERLRTIIIKHDSEGGFSGPEDYFTNIIKSIEKNRNFDQLDDEQKFWVYELMEWTQWHIIEVDPETF